MDYFGTKYSRYTRENTVNEKEVLPYFMYLCALDHTNCNILNKRPRGLDALLGHLLVKEYQKCKNLELRLAVSEIQHVQGRRKSEMH